ncbi:iron-containing alcohol dehydrogenase [Enterovibrio sp. ZSDZ35]|uniref:Iron-containing alcohol dehydrogenase n=1 Tax=Enterovibrio qingdaonensis TaxID=2899818 RepID=A0ABT5QNF2_9GAMM|nr:iron-containing alcohol dehydrogenase [Enterovibrio sp. ZSDZ35]MDD1782511.1 iron-containing alcohol dehydrogenase [Enterovibrio sp. ZSDZ35]
MSNSVAMPRILEFGEDATARLPDIVKGFNASRVLVLTDKTMVQMGYVAMVTELLSNAGINSRVYSNTIPEPTSQSIEEAVAVTRDNQIDCIVALGGGSAIDSAKAISMLASYGGFMRDYKAPRIVNETSIPVIAIPTTAGTGSEVTKFTIITDSDTDEKMLCIGLGFLPVAALIDYKLTMSLPPRITADTGIDALTHAIEAYVSKKGNPFSDYNALEAMRLIAPNLRKVFHDGNDIEARKQMMMGSTLAGIAFSNASVALVHGMSRPIGASFHVPHGLSNAMLLPSITAFSIPACEERYAQCAKAMGIVGEHVRTEDANTRLKQELLALNEELNVPTLAEFGVEKDDFDAVLDIMIQQAFASGSPGNNPRVPTEEEMRSLYQRLWK